MERHHFNQTVTILQVNNRSDRSCENLDRLLVALLDGQS